MALPVEIFPGGRVNEDVTQLGLGGTDPRQKAILMDRNGLASGAAYEVPTVGCGLAQAPLSIGQLGPIFEAWNHIRQATTGV
jgi:hypothetical protein